MVSTHCNWPATAVHCSPIKLKNICVAPPVLVRVWHRIQADTLTTGTWLNCGSNLNSWTGLFGNVLPRGRYSETVPSVLNRLGNASLQYHHLVTKMEQNSRPHQRRQSLHILGKIVKNQPVILRGSSIRRWRPPLNSLFLRKKKYFEFASNNC